MTEALNKLWIGIAGLLLMSGCFGDRVAGGTSVGNPPQGVVALSLEAASGPEVLAKASAAKDTSIPVKDSGGTVFNIGSALVNVGQVQIKLPDGMKCSDAIKAQCELDKVKLTTSFVADLMTGLSHPDLGTFQLPVGRYHRVEIKLEEFKEKILPPGMDSLLSGHTVLIKGSFAYAGKSDRKFSLVLDIGEVVGYESDSGLHIEEQGLNRMGLVFAAEKWIAGAGITSCLDNGSITLDPQGDLAIDKDNTCDGLEQALKDGFKVSGILKEKRD